MKSTSFFFYLGEKCNVNYYEFAQYCFVLFLMHDFRIQTKVIFKKIFCNEFIFVFRILRLIRKKNCGIKFYGRIIRLKSIINAIIFR